MTDLQETKFQNTYSKVVCGLWENSKVEFASSRSRGMSRGLLIIWREVSLELNYSFRRDCFVDMNVGWKIYSYYRVNVYSPCNINKKRKLWRYLVEIKSKSLGWDQCISGDLNSILSSNERKGVCDKYRSEVLEFKDFVVGLEVIDVPSIGNNFTWFSGDGKSMSKLDRFLLSEQLIDRWKMVEQLIG